MIAEAGPPGQEMDDREAIGSSVPPRIASVDETFTIVDTLKLGKITRR